MTIPNPGDTLGDSVVERTLRQLVVTTGRLVDNRSRLDSAMTAPYGITDETGRIELSSEVVKKTGAATETGQ